MPRFMVVMAVFFLSMNLFAAMAMSSGAAGGAGINAPLGGDDEVQEATRSSSNVSSGAPTGSTLFGMYNALANALASLSAPITAGPTMLNQAGVPSWITHDFLQPIIGVVYAIGIASFLRGVRS